MSGQLKVRFSWKDISGTLGSRNIAYLSDTLTPFSRNAYTHVFKEPTLESEAKDNANCSTQRLKWRTDIILEVCKRAAQLSTDVPLHHPKIHFKDGQVHLMYKDQAFPESLWREPLVVNNKTLEFVSRGLPFDNVIVFEVSGSPAMTEEEIQSKFKTFLSGRQRNSIHAIAQFYQVDGLAGGPIYTGDLRIFWQGYCQRQAPSFNGEDLKQVHFGK